MSTSADQLLDELMRILNYDNLNTRQLKVKLFEASLRVKTLKEELVEAKSVKETANRGNDILTAELTATKQKLHDAGDRVDMLEDIIDKKQQLIESRGYSPSLLVRKYNSASLIESSGPYCGGTAYVEADIISLESKLERAKRDSEELDIENTKLVETNHSLELEIEFLKTHQVDYDLHQDLKIRESILENDLDHLTQLSIKQEKQIEKQQDILSELSREVGILKKEAIQKENIIMDQKSLIIQKNEVIEASGVCQAEKDLEIEKLKNLVDEKDDIIEYYFDPAHFY